MSSNRRIGVSMLKILVLPILLLLLVRVVNGKRLFGEYLSPARSYVKGERIQSNWIRSLTSIHTLLPLSYDLNGLFCTTGNVVDDEFDDSAEDDSASSPSFSSWLQWDVLSPSPYEFHMLQEEYCRIVCKRTYDKDMAQQFQRLVQQGYHYNHFVDNSLPSAAIGWHPHIHDFIQKRYSGGFPIGFVSQQQDSKDAYIFNHLNIYIDYYRHQEDDSSNNDNEKKNYQVVGFGVEPLSIGYSFIGPGGDDEATCSDAPSNDYHWHRDAITQNQIVQENVTIKFTYDVIWRPSDVEWSNRWDIYLSEDHLVPAQVHQYSIANSAFTIVVMVVIVLVIWIRRIRHAAKFTPVSSEDEIEMAALPTLSGKDSSKGTLTTRGPSQVPGTSSDQQKWRLLHGDVFRPPLVSPMLLVVLCSTGGSLLATTLVTCPVLAIGLFSEIYPGTIIIGIFLIYTFVGSWIGGYTLSKFFQHLQLPEDRQHLATIATASFFPGMCFSFFLIINLWATTNQSPMAVSIWPFGISLVVVWGAVFAPLTNKGAKYGFDKSMTPLPVETNPIPRRIPPRSCFMGHFCPIFSWLMNGVFPFSVYYVELFFILTALFMGQCFNSFGYVTVVVILMIATASTLSILTTYWQLSRENHRWWWAAFRNGTSTGILTFAYSWFWYSSLETTWGYHVSFPMAFYFGISLLISTGLALAFGFVGVASSLLFNRIIYSMIAASA